MKNQFIFIVALAAFFCSCDTPQTIEDSEYSFFIFSYNDEADKEWIITTNMPTSDTARIRVVNGVYNFPKRYRDEPYYFGMRQPTTDYEKHIFDICELATEEKLLALHNGYYTYFPYTNIVHSSACAVRDGKWTDICSVNALDLPIRGYATTQDLYKDIRFFGIRSLEKITHKSRKEMTMDDIEKAINKVIDDGKLDKYSTKVYNFWTSYN